MTLLVRYDTKKELKAAIGQRLRFSENSLLKILWDTQRVEINRSTVMASDELILSSEHPSPPGRTWTRGYNAGYNSRVVTTEKHRRGPDATSGEYGQALVDALRADMDTWHLHRLYRHRPAGFASGFAAGWDEAAEEAEFIIQEENSIV